MGQCSSQLNSDDDETRPPITVRRSTGTLALDARVKCPACKIVLLGETSTGKTSLVQRFTRDHFDEAVCATIGAAFTSHMVDFADGRTVQLDIWDTAGQERYRTLAPLYYRNAAGAVVVYDITDKDSFASCKAWVEGFQEHRPPTTTIVLVGNKLDLESQRKVTQEEGKAFAQANNLLFIECSAKDSLFVTDCFELLASSMLDRLMPSSPP